MKKIKLYAIGNDGNFNYYVFEKTEYAQKLLGDVLGNCFKIYWPIIDENYDFEKEKLRKKNNSVEKKKDFLEVLSHYRNTKKGVRAEVFLGDKKMYLVIHCSLRDRKKFNEAIDVFTKMPLERKTG